MQSYYMPGVGRCWHTGLTTTLLLLFAWVELLWCCWFEPTDVIKKAVTTSLFNRYYRTVTDCFHHHCKVGQITSKPGQNYFPRTTATLYILPSIQPSILGHVVSDKIKLEAKYLTIGKGYRSLQYCFHISKATISKFC
jgi:hypothetical protein